MKTSKWRPFYATGSTSHGSEGLLSIKDLISEDNILYVCMMNFVVDPSWLVQECPVLLAVPVFLAHGQKSLLSSMFPSNFSSSLVNLGPEVYGSHHSKLLLIFYSTGIRVAVMTANLIECDFAVKSQGIYVQDFPLMNKSPSFRPVISEFGTDLVQYLKCVALHSSTAQTEFRSSIIDKLSDYDFSSAEVVLIPAVPGHHKINGFFPWGHLKLQRLVRGEKEEGAKMQLKFDQTMLASKVVMQCSSIGAMGKGAKYLDELASSMGAETRRNVRIVWPSLRFLQGCLEGYAAGSSIFCESKVLCPENGFIQCMQKWNSSLSGMAQFAAPHIKSYCSVKIKSTSQSDRGRRCDSNSRSNSSSSSSCSSSSSSSSSSSKGSGGSTHKSCVPQVISVATEKTNKRIRLGSTLAPVCGLDNIVDLTGDDDGIGASSQSPPTTGCSRSKRPYEPSSTEQQATSSTIISTSPSTLPTHPLDDRSDNIVELDWFLLTSANMSQAAWGVRQKSDTTLYIKSYELGVLFLPSRVKTTRRLFSCTPDHPVLGLDDEAGHIESAIARTSAGSGATLGVDSGVYQGDQSPAAAATASSALAVASASAAKDNSCTLPQFTTSAPSRFVVSHEPSPPWIRSFDESISSAAPRTGAVGECEGDGGDLAMGYSSGGAPVVHFPVPFQIVSSPFVRPRANDSRGVQCNSAASAAEYSSMDSDWVEGDRREDGDEPWVTDIPHLEPDQYGVVWRP